MFIFLFFILSIVFWYKRKYDISVTFLFLVASNGINLTIFNTGSSLLASHNYLFIFANYILLQDLARGTLKRDMKRDNVLRMVVYSYLFFFLHMLFSFLLGAEGIDQSFTVLRVNQTFLILYFIIRKLSTTQLRHSMRNLCILFSINVFLYILQYWGICVFNVEEMNYNEELSILRSGTPFAAAFFFLYWGLGKKNFLLALIALIPLIASSARGCLVSLVAAYAIYNFKTVFKPQRLVLYLIAGIGIAYFYTTYLADSFDRGNKTFYEELTSAFSPTTILNFKSYVSSSTDNVFDFTNNSTFSFRISMLLERIHYLFTHPQYILFGVGAINEHSTNNTFHFVLGTPDIHFKYGYCQIDSVDIIWVPQILRYGLSGVFFWIYFFRTLFKTFKKSSNTAFASAGAIYIIYMFLDGFGSDGAFRIAYMIPFYVFVSYINRNYITSKKQNSLSSNLSKTFLRQRIES